MRADRRTSTASKDRAGARTDPFAHNRCGAVQVVAQDWCAQRLARAAQLVATPGARVERHVGQRAVDRARRAGELSELSDRVATLDVVPQLPEVVRSGWPAQRPRVDERARLARRAERRRSDEERAILLAHNPMQTARAARAVAG